MFVFCNVRLLVLYVMKRKSASVIAKSTTFSGKQRRTLYTETMSIFAHAVKAPTPRTKDTIKIAYLYVGILAVFVLAQLATLSGFVTLVESWDLPGGTIGAYLLVDVILVAELLALPFLLRLKLSPLARIVSMIMTWIVPVIWLVVSLWLNVTINAVSNVGMLGTLVQLVPGWWAIFVSIALGLLAAWASWGMWPCRRKK